MRILYVAIDQTVPGTLGGSIHVQAVAEGLAALGHEVHVATQVATKNETKNETGSHSSRTSSRARQSETEARFPQREMTPGLIFHAMRPPFGRPALRWARAGAVTRLAREIGADVVIERYYNFGGEGVIAATHLGVPAVLEVNAPVIDYPGSAKTLLDRILVVEPMRRWRDRMCRRTALFITPSRAILPTWIDQARVLETEWGADVEKFRPGVTGPLPFTRPADRIVCVFVGAFRAWHGAQSLAESLVRLRDGGDARFGAVFIGDGPERARTEAIASRLDDVIFTGAISHDRLPACLAAADIGVAPFDVSAHPPLSIAFYWSPLKIFEYMAAGLPVVAPAVARLRTLVADGLEGVLYDADDPAGLDAALKRLADAGVRRAMGAAARTRAVAEYSWRAHCEAIDARLRRLVPHP